MQQHIFCTIQHLNYWNFWNTSKSPSNDDHTLSSRKNNNEIKIKLDANVKQAHSFICVMYTWHVEEKNISLCDLIWGQLYTQLQWQCA